MVDTYYSCNYCRLNPSMWVLLYQPYTTFEMVLPAEKPSQNVASPVSGQHGIELGNSQPNLQPWASYPGLAATMLPPINWRDIVLEQLARLPLSTTSALHPHPGGLISLKMEDGRLAIIWSDWRKWHLLLYSDIFAGDIFAGDIFS